MADLPSLAIPEGHQTASAVHAAAVTGDKRTLEKLLAATPELKDREDQLGRTPLMYCVLADRLDCAALLLKSGADVNRADRSQRSALHLAAQTGNYRFVRLLLARRANWMQKDAEETTPLHLATRPKSAKCLALLLKHMAPGEVDAQDRNKQTALHWSAYHNNPEHGRLLIRHNSNIGIPDVDGRIPLHWAAHSPDPGAAHMVRCILDAAPTESLLNWQDYEGRTPLHFAVAAGNEAVVEALTSYQGCRVTAYDNLFRTPLHWAALLGHAPIARRLLERHRQGAVPSDGQGATPLHYAAQSNYPDTVKVFLGHHSGSDDADLEGRTAFMWAAGKGSDDVVQAMLVLKPELDVNLSDRYGGTALHAASLAGHVSTVRLLLERGARADAADLAKQTPLFRACEMGHQTVVQALIEGGARVGLVDQDGRSPLHWAALGGNANVCRILMENAIDPNVQDSGGRTPLQCAAHGGYITCMAALLESKADANVQDHEGRTALHWSCNNGYLDAVKLLLAFEAFPNQMESSEERYTPLDYALLGEHHQVVQFMLERGALSIAAIQDIAATRIQAVYKGYKVRRAFQERKILLMKHELLRKGAAAKKREEGHRRHEAVDGIHFTLGNEKQTSHAPIPSNREVSGEHRQQWEDRDAEETLCISPPHQVIAVNTGSPTAVRHKSLHEKLNEGSPRGTKDNPISKNVNEGSIKASKAPSDNVNKGLTKVAKGTSSPDEVSNDPSRITEGKSLLEVVNKRSHKTAKKESLMDHVNERSPRVAKDKLQLDEVLVSQAEAGKRKKDKSRRSSKGRTHAHHNADRESEKNKQQATCEIIISARAEGRRCADPAVDTNSVCANSNKNHVPGNRLLVEGPRPVLFENRCQREALSFSGSNGKTPRQGHLTKVVLGPKQGKDQGIQGPDGGRWSPAGSSRPGSAKGGNTKSNDGGAKGSNGRKSPALPSLPYQTVHARHATTDSAAQMLPLLTTDLRKTHWDSSSKRLCSPPPLSWQSPNLESVPATVSLAVIERERARKELFRKKAYSAGVIQQAWRHYRLKHELSQLLSSKRHCADMDERWKRRTVACILQLAWGKQMNHSPAPPISPCKQRQHRRHLVRATKPLPSTLQQVYGISQDGKRLRPCRPNSIHRLLAKDLILGGH